MKIIRMKQMAALALSSITTVVIGISAVLMVVMWQGDSDMPVVTGMQDDYDGEQPSGSRHSGSKYMLQNPEEQLEENITSAVIDETDTQKSNRLEDIMGVLSSETLETE